MTNNWTLDELVKGAVWAADMYGEDALEAGQGNYILQELNKGRLYLAFPNEVAQVLESTVEQLRGMTSLCQSHSSDLIFEDSRNEYRVWLVRDAVDEEEELTACFLTIEKYSNGEGWREIYTRDEEGMYDLT